MPLLFLAIIFIALTTSVGADERTNEQSPDGPTIIISNQQHQLVIQHLPLSVVDVCKKVLQGDLQAWSTENYDAFNFAKRYEVVGIFDSFGHCVVFLVQDKKWIRLNDPQGLATISEILSLTKDKLKDYPRDSKFSLFIHDLSCIYQGYSGTPLAKGFAEDNDKNSSWEWWIVGDVRDRPNIIRNIRKLRALCGNVVKISGNNFEFTVNVITSRGGVDHWEVGGIIRADDSLRLTGVVVTKIEPDRTFNRPMGGDFR